MEAILIVTRAEILKKINNENIFFVENPGEEIFLAVKAKFSRAWMKKNEVKNEENDESSFTISQLTNG